MSKGRRLLFTGLVGFMIFFVVSSDVEAGLDRNAPPLGLVSVESTLSSDRDEGVGIGNVGEQEGMSMEGPSDHRPAARVAQRTREQSPEDASRPEFYTIQKGDTCNKIIRKFPWLNYRTFHALNPQLGRKLPHRLIPGRTVRLRPAPAAELSDLVPRVDTRPENVDRWKIGRPGQPLYNLDRVATYKGAAAEITFRDDSKIQMGEQSMIVVYGEESRRSRIPSGRGVELISGSLRGGLAALREDGQSPQALVARTPSAVVSASATDIRLDVDQDDNSRLSVYKGRAEMSAQGVSVEVPEGSGTLVYRGRPPEPPSPLPGAPKVQGNDEIRLLAVNQANADATIRWMPTEGTEKVVAEIARDPKFMHISQRYIIPSKIHALQVKGLEPGRYFIRLSSVDARGLHGFEASARISVLALRIDGAMEMKPNIYWSPNKAEIALVEGDEPVELRIDGRLSSPRGNRLQGGGRHTIEIRPRGASEDQGVRLELVLDGLEIDTEMSPDPIPLKGGELEIALRLRSPLGTVADLKGVTISSPSLVGGEMKADPDGTYHFTIQVPPWDRERTLFFDITLPGDETPRQRLAIEQKGR